MEQENTSPAPQGQCTGNCMNCTLFQRQYCASQICYNNMRMIGAMASELNTLSKEVKILSLKIETLQNDDDTLFNPIAQEGDGATE